MIVLTGGAGFIGSCFLARLNAEGRDDVLVVDNLGKTEKWRNLQGKRFIDYVHKSEFLFRLENDLLPKTVTAIVHLGACSSTTETDAEYMMENNYQYTKRIAEWALAHSVRTIYASSAATYGDGGLGFSDDDSLCEQLRPLNVYGYSKQLFDLWALKTGAYRELAGIKFFNVFGPNEYHKGDMMSVVCKSFDQVNETKKIRLFASHRPDYANGEQKRDFVYIKDCCDVLWWLLNNPKVNGIFNLGTGQARSWNELANAVFSAMNVPANIEYMEMAESLKPKYQYFTEATVDKLRQAGYQTPFTDLNDAVRDYIQRYLSQQNRYL